MVRSRLLIDRSKVVLTPKRRTNDAAKDEEEEEGPSSSKQTNQRNFAPDGSSSSNVRNQIDVNNFDFIVPCDIEDDSLDSQEIKNWRYHLTRNRL